MKGSEGSRVDDLGSSAITVPRDIIWQRDSAYRKKAALKRWLSPGKPSSTALNSEFSASHLSPCNQPLFKLQ
jgi:hypothetical protein